MGLINVNIWDATGAKRQAVQMPDDAPVNRILAVLLEKMSFPQYAPDGQLLSYKFHHRASGKQLLDEQTLASAGVKDGDVLRLQPESTAGSSVARVFNPCHWASSDTAWHGLETRATRGTGVGLKQ